MVCLANSARECAIRSFPGKPKAASPPRLPGICPKCQRGKHWANECRSQYDINKQPIPGSWKTGPAPFPPNNGGSVSSPDNFPQRLDSNLILGWIREIGPELLVLELIVDRMPFQGLIDTGAEMSIFSQQFWPSSWLVRDTTAHIFGIGTPGEILVSCSALTWEAPGRHPGQFSPFVLNEIRVNIWGRDILSQMSAKIYSPSLLEVQPTS